MNNGSMSWTVLGGGIGARSCGHRRLPESVPHIPDGSAAHFTKSCLPGGVRVAAEDRMSADPLIADRRMSVLSCRSSAHAAQRSVMNSSLQPAFFIRTQRSVSVSAVFRWLASKRSLHPVPTTMAMGMVAIIGTGILSLLVQGCGLDGRSTSPNSGSRSGHIQPAIQHRYPAAPGRSALPRSGSGCSPHRHRAG